MIIDCHTHLSSPEQSVDYVEHQRVFQELDGCFVLACLKEDRIESNRIVAEYLEKNPHAIGFAVIDPIHDFEEEKSIQSITVDQGFKGIVLYCAEGQFHPTHSQAMCIYEQCQELGLVVFFHNSPPFSQHSVMEYAQPVLLDEVARDFPDLKLILGRMGIPFIEQTVCLLSKHPNVYADLTIVPQKVWQVYNMVMSAYEAGVMDKLLFGSGYPYAGPDVCIETLLGFNKLLSDTHLPQVPREKLRSIVERDTQAILGLK